MLCTVAVYWPVVGFDFVNYDDQEYVYENANVLQGLSWQGAVWAFTKFHSSNWHPVTWLSHMLDVSLFGLRPGGHHLTNLLLHAVNTAILFLLLWRLTDAQWRSALVAAFFALHPLHVESVAWIAERKDLLSAFFGFLTLICYTHYAQRRSALSVQGSRVSVPWTWSYVAALGCFALGLMSKPMLVTWPFVMLLFDYWPLKRIAQLRFSAFNIHLLTEKLPFFALSAASCAVTMQAQREAMRALSEFPLSARLANALVSYVRYLGKAFWPSELIVPYPTPSSWPLPVVLAAAVFIAGMSFAVIQFAGRRSYLFVGWYWYVGTLVPVIGLVQVGVQAMADRYTYVPLIGIFIILSWGAAELAVWSIAARRAVVAAALLVLAACGFKAADQLQYWRDGGTLARHAASRSNENDVAYIRLGLWQINQGQLDDGITSLRAALRTMGGPAESPDMFVTALADESVTNTLGASWLKVIHDSGPKRVHSCAEILNNLGLALAMKGRTDKAMMHYRAALRLRPTYAKALQNLAFELAALGRYDQAIPLFEAAVRADPDHAEIRRNLGQSLIQVGRVGDAARQYAEAVRLAPRDPRALSDLGLALATLGHTADAISNYQAALRLDPTSFEAHVNFGNALMSAGQLDEAAAHFRQALSVNPRHAMPHEHLGVTLAMQERLGEAEFHLREAVQLSPASADAHFNLANVLASQQKRDEALREFSETLRLAPDHAPAHANLAGVLAELGRRDEAIAHLREALRLEPGSEQARQQLRDLGVQPTE